MEKQKTKELRNTIEIEWREKNSDQGSNSFCDNNAKEINLLNEAFTDWEE